MVPAWRAPARFFLAAPDTKTDTRPDTKPREFNHRNARIPWPDLIPCYVAKISLFRCVGNFRVTHWIFSRIWHLLAGSQGLKRSIFPVFSQLAGNLGNFRDEFARDSPRWRLVFHADRAYADGDYERVFTLSEIKNRRA